MLNRSNDYTDIEKEIVHALVWFTAQEALDAERTYIERFLPNLPEEERVEGVDLVTALANNERFVVLMTTDGVFKTSANLIYRFIHVWGEGQCITQ
jgi:hypothetical protein